METYRALRLFDFDAFTSRLAEALDRKRVPDLRIVNEKTSVPVHQTSKSRHMHETVLFRGQMDLVNTLYDSDDLSCLRDTEGTIGRIDFTQGIGEQGAYEDARFSLHGSLFFANGREMPSRLIAVTCYNRLAPERSDFVYIVGSAKMTSIDERVPTEWFLANGRSS